jgi:LuxR family transcriptional regulator, maltose regulon positive regulatory protein
MSQVPVEGLGPPSFAFEAVATRATVQLLRADPFPRLVAVSAPPGYGKTVLMSTVHREMLRRGMRCLWVTLDDRDTDLRSLLFRLRGALVDAGVELSEEMAGPRVAFHDQTAPLDAMVRLLAGLSSTDLLFIDNLGECRDPELRSFLDRLVFGNKEGLRLLLSSTSEAPLDLARAKLELGALEIGVRHLSLDRDGVSAVLERAGVTSLREADLDRIITRTEGWPAAVRLVQVLLASEGDGAKGDARSLVDATLDSFGGDQGDMARVLTQRVLRGFGPDVMQFMVELSLVREFSVELAMHMTGRHQAREWLDRLVSQSVLTFPVDSRRRWFRFHTLLREHLMAEGEVRLAPQRRSELREAAARWHMAAGHPATAIDLALEAGAVQLAHDLLDRVAHVVVGDQGQMGSFVQWVDRLTAAGGRPSFRTHAWFVWALCDSLQYERARRALEEFDERAAADPAFVAQSELPARLTFLRLLVNLFTDRMDVAHQQAIEWLERGEQADALTVATVVSIAAIVEIERGELVKARVRMQHARSVIERSESAYGHAWVAILTACIDIGQARPNAADTLLCEARARVVPMIGEDAGAVASLDFVHARALLDLGRANEAYVLAARRLESAARHGILTSLEQGLVASVACWSGAQEGPIDDANLNLVANSYPPRGASLLAASKVRRLIALGRPEAAQLEWDRAGLAGSPKASAVASLTNRGEWLLARLDLLVAQGACDAVGDAADGALKVAMAQGRERDRVELLLLAADAKDRSGQTRQALRLLAVAVALAAPGRLMQPFLYRRGLLSRLLADVDAKGIGAIQPAERSLVERLRLQLAEHVVAERPPDDAPTSDLQLTIRQLQLLKLIDEGLSNEQVADRMSLSVPTVKWHLHNAYGKLGVRSRSAALARARALKLLGP